MAMRKKTPLTRSLMAAASIVALSAVMYGCSSSGENAANDRAKAAEDALAKAQMDLATAQAAQKAAEDAAAAAATAQMAAETARDAAIAAQATAEMERDAAKAAEAAAEAARAVAVAAQEAAEAAQGMAEADRDAANAARDAAVARAEAAEAARDAAVARAEKAEMDLAALQNEAERLRQEAAAKAASAKAAEVLKALATPSGTAPEITVKASSAGVLTAEAATYTQSGTAPDAISGFRGAILTKKGAEAHVYTDIENATATPIDDIYSASSAPGKPKVYTLATDTAGNNNINWSDANRANTTNTITGSGETQTTTFAGDVRGLAGTFTCTGSCTAPTETAQSVISGQSGTWTFKPNNASGTIDVADDKYLQFGWWMNAKGNDVDDGYDIRTFASAPGMTAYAGQGGSATTGSATFTGGAAGKWAMASTTSNSTAGGHFTATATLGVDFDADSTPDSDANDKNGVSVSGTISNFMTGDTARPNWRVELTVDSNTDTTGNQPLSELGATVGTGQNAAATWKTGGAVDGTGTWSASFWGAEKDTSHPTDVTGTFNAAIASGAVGRIQGAFGASQ